MINVIKRPDFEDDSYLIEMTNFELSNDQLDTIIDTDRYLTLKCVKFMDQDITPDGFEAFSDRPSLRNINKSSMLTGSIYTYASAIRNDLAYNQITPMITKMLKQGSRRAYLRMCNSLNDYHNSMIFGTDVSCLSNIHYLEDRVNLTFRASDVKNELFADIITIYIFFIQSIYKKPIKLSIFASTAQNIDSFDNLVKQLRDINE